MPRLRCRSPGPKAKVGAGRYFALGVMMYRMLSGRHRPLAGLENDQRVLYHNANIEMPALTDGPAPGETRDIAGLISP